ncbi:MAG: DUF2341 domain-containing protein [Candidatus Hermodarchaeota archaeon]
MNWIKPRKVVLRYSIVIGIIVLFVYSGTLSINIYLENVGNNTLINLTPNDRHEDNILASITDIPLGWSYESNLTLDPVTPEPNYQVKVILNPYSFNYSKAKPDGSDLRFYDPLNTPLSYWIESWNPAGKSIIWVKVPNVGTSTIHMYYGNPTAMSESDGDATFIFFDDFEGSAVNTSKWTTDNDQYSSTIVSGGVLTVTTYIDDVNERNGGAVIGFNDFYLTKPPAPYNAYTNNSINFGSLGRGHQIQTKAATASLVVDNALAMRTWDTRDIRWISDSLVQYNNGTSIITHTNSTCIPDMPLGIRILTHATYYGPGWGCSGAVRSVDTVGSVGRALRARTYHDCAYDGLAPPSIQVDWVFVRKCVEQEPLARVDNIHVSLIRVDPATPEADYQIKVNLNPNNFDYSLANFDGRDLRFYDIYTNPLSYWIETWNPTGVSMIWVKIPSPGTSSLYMYYGNPSASSESDGDDTFIFFDDFEGSTVNTSKWITDNDQYSSTIVSGGVLTVTTYIDDVNERNGGAVIGFNDFYLTKPPAPYNAYTNNSINFGSLGRGHQIQTKAATASLVVDNALAMRTWDTRDIRWISDSLVQYNNGTSIITHTNSTCIPDMPLGIRILTHATYYGPGWGCSGAVRSVDTVGSVGRALRARTYHDCAYDGLAPPSIQVDWVFVRKCVEQEPAVTVVNQTINLISPEDKIYSAPMSGYYPASYGFEDDVGVPYSDITISGHPPSGWSVYYPGQYGKLRVLEEFYGHKNVVELRKDRGTFGKDRVGMTKNFASSATIGTVEFWFHKDSDSGLDATKFKLLGSGGNIEFGIEDKALYHGPYTTKTTIATNVFPKDTWLHIRVDFDITQGGWQIQLNNTWYGSGYAFLFEGSPIDIYGFDLRSHGIEFQSGNPLHDFYLDALGYSWDPCYNIGDNLKEGLLLDFEPPTKSRTDWAGYYPASEGFEDVSVGTEPDNWGWWQGGSIQPTSVDIQVLNSKTDAYGNFHSKVLYCKDNDAGPILVADGFFNNVITSGTLEFWVLHEAPGTNWRVSWGLLKAASPYDYTVRVADEYNEFEYFDGNTSIDTGITFSENKWYRLSIDFSDDGTYAGLAPHHYRVRLYDSDGSTLIYESPDAEFQYHGSSSGIHVSTGDSVQSNLYFDAFGYSWDPNYNIGDNRFEAVNEGSEPADLSWIGYSLDNSSYIPIEGKTSIVLPATGSHTIQLYITDILDNWYTSEQRSFFCLLSVPSITSPSDFSIFHGDTGYSILWSVTDLFPANYSVYRNGTIYRTGSWTNYVLVWLDGLEEGVHNFTCVVENAYGRTSSDEVWIRVLPSAPDTTPPSISSPNDVSFEEGSIGYSIIWTGSDDRTPWWASVRKNMTLIYDKAWIGNDIVISLDGVATGLYKYNCTLFDEAGNSVYDVVWVNVTEAVPDTESPVNMPPGSLEFEKGTTGHILHWICLDNHPFAYTILINDTEELFNPWHGENISYSVDHLPIGTWNVTLTLYDLASNTASSSVIVTVNPEAPDVTPPTVSQPAKSIIAENTAGTIIWEVDDKYPDRYMITRNGSIIYEKSSWVSGIIQYHYTSLPLGTWEFILTVWDVAGHSASGIAIVEVIPTGEADTFPPTISQIQDVVFTYGTLNNYIIAYLFDVHPQGYLISIGTDTIIVEHTWTSPNIKVEFCLDGLVVGNYNIIIIAWDTFGNNASRSVSVTVQGDTDPPILVHLPDITVEENINITLTWQVTDETPSHYELIMLPNGDIEQSGSWSGTSIEIVITALPLDTYQYRLIVYDMSGNYAIDDFTLIVVPKTGRAPGFELTTTAIFILFFTKFRSYFNLRRRKRK